MGLAGSAGVELFANTAKFQEGLQAAARDVEGFRSGLNTLDGHSKKLQNQLFNLAGAATGVTGPLGKIAEIGITMGVGGWAGAAAAGIALIAGAFKGLKDAADEAFEATTKVLDPLRKRREGTDKFLAEQNRLRYIQESLGRGQMPVLTPGEAKAAGVRFFLGDRESNMKAIKAWLDQSLADLAFVIAHDVYQLPGLSSGPKVAVAKKVIGIEEDGKMAMWRLLGGATEAYDNWLRRMTGDMERKRAFYKAILPDVGDEPVGPTTRLPKTTIPKSVQSMIDDAARWQDAWLQARQAVEYAISDLFMTIADQSRTVLDILRQLLLTLARIAANMLASKVVSALIPSQAPNVSGGMNVTVNNAFALSAIEPAGMEAAIMAAYPAVTAATLRGVSESSAAARFLRGY